MSFQTFLTLSILRECRKLVILHVRWSPSSYVICYKVTTGGWGRTEQGYVRSCHLYVRGSPPSYLIYYNTRNGWSEIPWIRVSIHRRGLHLHSLQSSTVTSLHLWGHVPSRSYEAPSFLEGYRIHFSLPSGDASCLDQGWASSTKVKLRNIQVPIFYTASKLH